MTRPGSESREALRQRLHGAVIAIRTRYSGDRDSYELNESECVEMLLLIASGVSSETEAEKCTCDPRISARRIGCPVHGLKWKMESR